METSWSDERSMAYHLDQFTNQKRSTEHFYEFSAEFLKQSQFVIDIGCGTGAATHFIAKSSPSTRVLGIDSDPILIQNAKSIVKKLPLPNLDFEVTDLYELKDLDFTCDGVVSLQTLSWLEGIDEPMISIFTKLQPRWIALSSLFYEGDITATIIIDEHKRNRQSYYNVYSIPKLARLSKEFGYVVSKVKKFSIDVDLPKPPDVDFMSTYTEKLVTADKDTRIQISGPILMNWYFVMIEIREEPSSQDI
jgi:SAM-dependent methyltransferase